VFSQPSVFATTSSYPLSSILTFVTPITAEYLTRPVAAFSTVLRLTCFTSSFQACIMPLISYTPLSVPSMSNLATPISGRFEQEKRSNQRYAAFRDATSVRRSFARPRVDKVLRRGDRLFYRRKVSYSQIKQLLSST
jgi:hypothetical protein